MPTEAADSVRRKVCHQAAELTFHGQFSLLLKSKVLDMKSYKQFCGTAYALDLLGERWTLLILRDLLAGPRRYGDLIKAFPGITTNLLAKRLKDLTDAGLIQRAGRVYTLTEAGRRTEPIILALAEFGSDYLTFPTLPDERVSSRSMVLNLKRRYGGGWTGAVILQFSEATYLIQSDGQNLDISDHAANKHCTTTLVNKTSGFARWILLGARLADLIESAALDVVGDVSTALTFDETLR